ncbi:MAG: 16S rRNA (cytosine(967)-C(5))-methyltransferase RsmB [Lysobacterales bacterium]|jgi:16S rRNA (cytosine967-C5)-methyltransferase
MSGRPGLDSRLHSLELLRAVLDGGRNLAEPGTEWAGAGRDRAFARYLAYGVLRWMPSLEWLAARLLQRPFKHRDRQVHRLVLQGLFELWKDASTPHAAIHETAECARALGKPWAVGVVNAVLRRFQRERTDLLEQLADCDERFAHPGWLLSRLRVDWPEEWPDIVCANNEPAPLWLRLNRSLPDGDAPGQLVKAGFRLTRHPYATDAVRIEPAAPVEELPGFAEGLFSVQDPAAQLAAGLLDLRDGLRVLDACAAPGGKSCHILETAPGVQLTALDRSAERLEKVRENLGRLGLGRGRNQRLQAADATDPSAWWDGEQFDRILLDAPCSASGVIRRHPEIKYLRNPGQVTEAVALQARLLNELWPLLKPGGMLLYATCSVFHAENSSQISQFAARVHDAESPPIPACWGRELDPGRQILPGEQEMDGFFYARLRKTL